MFESVGKVELSNGDKINCYDLTFGLISDIESGKVVESTMMIVLNGTDLTENDVRDLRKSDVDTIYSKIMRLTYPELYDDNGELITIPDADEDDSKKKV